MNLLQQATNYLTQAMGDHVTWFWLGIGIVLSALVPRGRISVLVLCTLIALLPPSISFLLLLFVGAILFVKFGVLTVPEGSTALVLRLGKYTRTLAPGIQLIIPGLEKIHVPVGLVSIDENGDTFPLCDKKGLITMKEFILDPAPQDMICQDNSVVTMDSIAYLRISTPHKAAFGVENLGDSFLKLVETVLRQEVGKLDGDAVVQSRETIGSRLQQALTTAAEPWGTVVVRVEIQDITFKKELQEALSKAREEELSGRAKVVAAQRARDAVIAKAEGDKRAAELEAEAKLALAKADAEGEFLAESRRREGEAQGLRAVSEALRETPEALLTLESIKQQPEVAKGLSASDSLIVVPSETAGLIGTAATLINTVKKINSSSDKSTEE